MPFESKVRFDGSLKPSASTNRLLAFLLIAFFVLAGCSGSKTSEEKSSSKMLDEKTAEEQVEEYVKRDPAHFFVDIGRVGTACVLTLPDGSEILTDMSPMKQVTSLAAQTAGYISVTPDGKGFWKVGLTEKGKAAMSDNPVPNPPKKGCDYQEADFMLGTQELVRITDISADKDAPDVGYLWRWNVTDLGRELRADGKIYAALTPEQRKALHDRLTTRIVDFPIPAPQENYLKTGAVSFKRYTDGWRIQ